MCKHFFEFSIELHFCWLLIQIRIVILDRVFDINSNSRIELEFRIQIVDKPE